jgi:hypothetical protein
MAEARAMTNLAKPHEGYERIKRAYMAAFALGSQAREFIALLVGPDAAWPLGALAQQRKRLQRGRAGAWRLSWLKRRFETE